MKNNLLITTAIIGTATCLSIKAEGALYTANAGDTIELEAKVYENNDTQAENGNGSLAAVNGGTLKIAGGAEVKNNKAVFGGAIFNKAGRVETGKMSFEGNEASSSGGVIYNYQPGAEVLLGDDSSFKNNKANKAGGVINNASQVTIESNALFSGNEAGTNGGAIYNNTGGILKVRSNAVFSGNKAGTYGGALVNNNGTVEIGENAVFSGNIARAGGAITTTGSLIIGDGARFEGNESSYRGGALYIMGASSDINMNNVTFKNNKENVGYGGAIALDIRDTTKTVTITNASFEGNTATKTDAQIAGGIYVGNGNMKIKDSTFTGNKASFYGALATATGNTSGVFVSLDNVTFRDNEAKAAGAVANFASKTKYADGGMVIKNSKFINNKATAQSEGAAALFLGSESVTLLDNVTFDGNTSASSGGAIGVREANGNDNRGSLKIVNSTFINNTVATTGGALDNHFENMVIENTSFIGNSAAEGGAIFNHDEPDSQNRIGTLKLAGNVSFEGNTAEGKLNDIHNLGVIKVEQNSQLSLDGGISGETGVTDFAKDSTLNVKQGVTVIENEVNSAGTTLNVSLVKGAKTLDLNDIFTHENNMDKLDNLKVNSKNVLNTLVQDKEDLSFYEIIENPTSEVASSLEITNNAAKALQAFVSSDESTSNAAFNAVSDALYTAALSGDSSVVQEAEKLGATPSPIAQVVETMRSNMIFNAVSDELNEADGATVEGISAGDYFHEVKAWIRGLFNYADMDDTSKAAGFDADTYGTAMGIDKNFDNNIKVGLGYAYSKTDVNGKGRDWDVKGNTIFAYGQYKPTNGYIKALLAYSHSDYDEKKNVLGYNANAKYDVDTFTLQAVYGLEYQLNVYDINPEFGLRYMYIDQAGYTDKLGSTVRSKDSDILTLIAGAKIARDVEFNSNIQLRPELKAAVTYDLISDHNNADVVLLNGAAYRVNGEKLERLGVELGARVSANLADNWEMTAGYEIRLRKDYWDNTLMLNAKYSF